MKKILFCLVVALTIVTACKDNKQQKAEQLLAQAEQSFSASNYSQALALVDSVRKVYPNAIDTRRKALKLYQKIELKKAQDELGKTDSLLQSVQHDLNYQQLKADKDKAALRATAEQLTHLTKTRMRRDSLRTQCETLGAKIRYIRKKQKE